MFILVTLLFSNGVIQLHNFSVIKMHSNNYYDHKVHTSKNHYNIYKEITFRTKYSLNIISKVLNFIKLLFSSDYDYGLG